MEDIKFRLSRRLRRLREKRGFTQQELSEFADIEYKHIQRLESRKPCDVKLSTLQKLAKGLNVPLSKLLDFE